MARQVFPVGMWNALDLSADRTERLGLCEGRKGYAEHRGDDRAYPARLGLLDRPDPEVGSEGADADCWATGGLRGVLSGQQKNPNFGIAGWTVSFHLEKTRLS